MRHSSYYPKGLDLVQSRSLRSLALTGQATSVVEVSCRQGMKVVGRKVIQPPSGWVFADLGHLLCEKPLKIDNKMIEI